MNVCPLSDTKITQSHSTYLFFDSVANTQVRRGCEICISDTIYRSIHSSLLIINIYLGNDSPIIIYVYGIETRRICILRTTNIFTFSFSIRTGAKKTIIFFLRIVICVVNRCHAILYSVTVSLHSSL